MCYSLSVFEKNNLKPIKEWQKIDGFFNPSFVLKENSSSKTDCFGVGHLSHDHVSQTNTPCDSGSSVVVPPRHLFQSTLLYR